MRALARVLFPILVLAAPNAFAADQPATHQDVPVVLSNFNFNPNMLHLQRGAPATLHLTNSASGGHAFSAPELFAASTISPEDRSKISNGRIEIAAGQTVDITLTPMTAGTYAVVCTHFLHQSFGMRGSAVVE